MGNLRLPAFASSFFSLGHGLVLFSGPVTLYLLPLHSIHHPGDLRSLRKGPIGGTSQTVLELAAGRQVFIFVV